MTLWSSLHRLLDRLNRVGVGILAGVGAKFGSKELAPTTGILAAVIAVLSICAAKYVAVDVAISQALSESDSSEMSDELAISYFADDVVLAWDEEGRTLEWPDGEAPEFPEAEADYPADVWQEATSQWGELAAAEQEKFKGEKLEMFAAVLEASRGDAFTESFGMMDLLSLALAIITAFKIGSGAAEVSET